MPSVHKNPKIKEWEVIVSFVNSGVWYWTLLSYPFALEREAGWFYFAVQLCVSWCVVIPTLIVGLGIGQLNQTGVLSSYGEMVPLLRGVVLNSKYNLSFV